MDALSQLWTQAVAMLGAAAVLFFLVFLVSTFFIGIIVILSIKRHKFYFPRMLLAGFATTERAVKGICKLMNLRESELSTFFVSLHNRMNEDEFSKVALEDRAVFLPHCLRSTKCPANLTPEGLACRHCGRCDLDRETTELERMGYRVFIVPGSTFVQRMAMKYEYRAIIGVGCPREIKDGLRSADKMGLIAMGVVNKTDGCIETVADWPELMKVASLGAPKAGL